MPMTSNRNIAHSAYFAPSELQLWHADRQSRCRSGHSSTGALDSDPARTPYEHVTRGWQFSAPQASSHADRTAYSSIADCECGLLAIGACGKFYITGHDVTNPAPRPNSLHPGGGGGLAECGDGIAASKLQRRGAAVACPRP